MNNPSTPTSAALGAAGMAVNIAQGIANGGGPLVNPIGAQPPFGAGPNGLDRGGAAWVGGGGQGPTAAHSGIGGSGAVGGDELKTGPVLLSGPTNCMTSCQWTGYYWYLATGITIDFCDTSTFTPNSTLCKPCPCTGCTTF